MMNNIPDQCRLELVWSESLIVLFAGVDGLDQLILHLEALGYLFLALDQVLFAVQGY